MSDNGKLFAIAVLAVTAVLLLCTMLIVDRMPANPAYAGASPDRSPGDYLMITGLSIKGDECVYVIDIAAQKVGVYRADPNNKQNGVLLVGALDLKPPGAK